MTITSTPIPGLLIIEPKVFEDNRGCFFEFFNDAVYKAKGLETDFVQDNISYSVKNTIRGLHYQLAPYAQTKLVQVMKGRVMDVAVDLRENSPTFGQHYMVELSDANKRQFYIPKGFAHGFIALSEEVVFFYKCNAPYNKDAERGINFNDPHLGIDWSVPVGKAIVSPKDEVLPSFNEAEKNFSFHEE